MPSGIETMPVNPVNPEPINKPKPTEEPGKPMPRTTLTPPAIELAPSSSRALETENQHPFELSRRYETLVSRAPDDSSITGQLFFVHADGGLWVLRYAPLGQEDPHGGGVILARNRQMDSYREGDLVTVKGEILQEKGSLYLGDPLYLASSIELVDRTDR